MDQQSVNKRMFGFVRLQYGNAFTLDYNAFFNKFERITSLNIHEKCPSASCKDVSVTTSYRVFLRVVVLNFVEVVVVLGEKFSRLRVGVFQMYGQSVFTSPFDFQQGLWLVQTLFPL